MTNAISQPAPRRQTGTPGNAKRPGERSALGLMEEAFHLLRSAPLSVHCWIFAGMIPFALVFLVFWSDMSRSSRAGEHLVEASLAATLCYFWMKLCQAMFCRALWRNLAPDAALPGLGPGLLIRAAGAQMLVHAVAIPCLLIALVFVLPLAWVFAFFQNATVFAVAVEPGARPLRNLISRSARHARHAAMQNHLALLLLKAFAIFVWFNIVTLLFLAPYGFRTITGIENTFSTSPLAAVMNPTFIALSLMLSWLCLAPFVKAVYVLRCFYGLAETSGADLLATLHAIRARDPDVDPAGRPARRGKAAALLAMGALLSLTSPAPAPAQEPKPGPYPLPGAAGAAAPSPEAVQLQEAIARVIKKREYEWRLPRERANRDDAANEERGLAGWLSDVQKAVDDFFSDGWRALRKWFARNQDSAPPPSMDAGTWGSLFGEGSLRTAVLAVVAALAAALIALLVRAFLERARTKRLAGDGEDPAGDAVDLEAEGILADQLPEDEWLRLAREQIARGESRLAIRALFLAGLAHLAERRFLKIARWKSNRDYRDELRLRAGDAPELLAAFEGNTAVFERVCYGLHEAGEGAVAGFMQNYETIAAA